MPAKKSYTRKTKEQIQAEVKKVVEDALPKIRLQSTTPEERKAFLDFMATGYRYSTRNMALIQSQYQGAHLVGSFQFWKDKGFSVQKGEHAIKILVPHEFKIYRDPATDKYLTYDKLTPTLKAQLKTDPNSVKTLKSQYFNLGNVFDVLQTNAKPEDYPQLYPNKPFDFDNPDPEGTKKAISLIKGIAEKEGVAVTSPETTGFPTFQLGAAKGAAISTEGSPKEIVMKKGLSDTEYAATLIHELAHVKMHNTKHVSASKFWNMNDPESSKYRDIKEFQAEMTSYVVSKSLGIDTTEESMPYIAGWTKNLEAVEGTEEQQQAAILGDVQRVSKNMIETIQDGLAPEQEKKTTKRASKEAELARG